MQCTMCHVSMFICKHPVTTSGSQQCESKWRFNALHTGLPQGTLVHFPRLCCCVAPNKHHTFPASNISWVAKAQQPTRASSIDNKIHKILETVSVWEALWTTVQRRWMPNNALQSQDNSIHNGFNPLWCPRTRMNISQISTLVNAFELHATMTTYIPYDKAQSIHFGSSHCYWVTLRGRIHSSDPSLKFLCINDTAGSQLPKAGWVKTPDAANTAPDQTQFQR